MGYYSELDKLEALQERDSWSEDGSCDAKYYEGYLISEGRGFRDYETGEFIYQPQEMGY